MPLIRNGEPVDDGWIRIGDDAPLPEEGDVLLPLERAMAEMERIRGRKGRVGAILENTADPRRLANLLPHLELIVLEFPAFTDGRAYSQARHLRSRLGYTGELRASGDVLPDQAAFMERVGFDSFEVAEDVSLATWNRARHAISGAYQRGYGGSAVTPERYGAASAA
ncbi:MAG: DUF934 domain-containing protein [Alphaproteobacteria bacterium]|nr:MAG: DUF934 domain-containing protein [Alphaproteobacteria bacterium]